MRTGAIWAMILTGLLVTAGAVATGALWLFMWALALNGFMGQDQAVNASMITFFVLVVIVSLTSVALSVYSSYYFSVRRMWNAAGSAVLSVVVFATLTAGLQLASLFISVLVASVMRT